MAAKVFFSYSHEDEALRDEIAKHLAVMKRNGEIEGWYDRDIDAGKDLDPTISRALEASDIVLCLVSADFLNSNYCVEKEMSRALERRRAGDCEVIPVILRKCDWLHSPLAALRATPRDGKPVTSFTDPDDAFHDITQDIRRVARELEQRRKTAGAVPAAVSPMSVSVAGGPARAAAAPAPATGPGAPGSRIRRKFTDEQRDEFLEQAFGTIASVIERELNALQSSSHLKGKFQRVDAQTFTGAIYEEGERAAAATIWQDVGSGFRGGGGIYYASALQTGRNSYNEMLTIADDGYELYLKPLGMAMMNRREEKLSPDQAAAYLWEIIMQRFTA